MSNYVEYNGKIAFHPGYYIKEIIDDSGLTQEDFAKRLDTTPKNLSCLIRGGQSLSMDIAMKLSRMLGSSIEYWLNLQKNYDVLIAEFQSDAELEEEKRIFEYMDYAYFRENFGLPDFPKEIAAQIKSVREFLQVSSLSVFKRKDLSVSFRCVTDNLNEENIVKANIMVQIGINTALKTDVPQFNKKGFEHAAEYALTLTNKHDGFLMLLQQKFAECGVILVIVPHLSGAKISGAAKKIDKNVVLMVNDSKIYSDSFWFTLFHEIGHILNSDYGISFENAAEQSDKEQIANAYAETMLMSQNECNMFAKV